MKQLEKVQEQGKEKAIYSYSQINNYQEEELIRLTDSVVVRNIFSLFKLEEEKILVNCVVKPWTGYRGIKNNIENSKEEMVYMTEQGKVFHRDRGCTHLSLSIQLITGNDSKIKLERYTPCEHCFKSTEKNKPFNLALYITNFGDRYHKTINCKSLKRTVRCIPLSQVKGVPECTKCR